MTTIILIRHGETKGNREGLFRGQMDFPLNENGEQQARDLAHALKNYDLKAVYASPLARAKTTAEIVASPHNLKIEIESGFTNINLGLWQGKPKAEIQERFPDLWQLWITEPERLQLPQGETLGEVQNRSFEALVEITQKHSGQSVAIVSHRAVLKPLLARALGVNPPYFWRFHLDNGSYSILEYTPQRGYILTLLNEIQHLRDFIKEIV
jgi:probable phosphoglycerate mutase